MMRSSIAVDETAKEHQKQQQAANEAVAPAWLNYDFIISKSKIRIIGIGLKLSKLQYCSAAAKLSKINHLKFTNR